MHISRSTRIRFAALLVVAQGVPALAAAQSTAHADLDPRRLRAAVDTIAVTVEAPMGKIAFATAIQTLRQVPRPGGAAWEQTYQWFGRDGSRTADTLWFAVAGLQPLEEHRHNAREDAVVRFRSAPGRMVVSKSSNGAGARDTAYAGEVFASGELESLIRAAPLAEGYQARFDLYYGEPRPVRAAPIRVVRSEQVTTRRGETVDCWVVDADLSEGLNTFFVTKTDHRIVRLVNHEDPTAAFVFTW